MKDNIPKGRRGSHKNIRAKNRNQDRMIERREEAEKRNNAWNSLTPQQKLNSLDGRLGKGIGAKKQRARIHAEIESMKNAD